MNTSFNPIRVAGLAAVCLAASVTGTRACPVPVYQYALEHWPTDPYKLVVHRAGELSDDGRAAVDFLKQIGSGKPLVANLTLQFPETDAKSGATAELHFAKPAGIRAPVWSGELSSENARAIVSSPVREQVAEALMARTSAVWVLLGSGDARADGQLEQLLRKELDQVEKETVIAETAEWGGETVKIDNNVNFKIVRLDRDDPAEQMFIRMLLSSEPDLKELDGQAMAFPIYGRGLLLYALIGRGINGHTIRKATTFLTSPCSCQIKAGNPGTDLLIAADWENGVKTTTPATVGVTAGTGSFLQRLDEAAAQDD